ncbi:Uu.00g123990.m01.CDS01 [Anthostomella pinea]|uniref:Uu.00g123990.m01.CDS01 n=1 Tax=Anthostomella pinea TaxID=933095 RepID=A0AAI8VIG2_9PEZI|nr:Uu.00g123990.m01.CDS01 [Anthostomella pinea]
MPGGYPQSRPSSRPAASRDSEETDTSYNRSSSQSNPPRGILKNSSPRDNQDHLAARFYRVPRPEHMKQTSPLQSPTYFSDSSYPGFEPETDSQSGCSELSMNTQATSVVSDTTDEKPTRPSTQVKHVRHVPLPAVGRVKARPRNRPPSEVTRSPSQGGKRTVHIQILPQAGSSTQDLQLARQPERNLQHKIERLENDNDDLRYAQSQLSRELDDTSEQLSAKVLENKELGRALSQERNAKQLVLRDLEEQRKLFDEFRSNYQLQKGMLQEAEKDRDSFQHVREQLEEQLVSLEKEMAQRDIQKKEQEELLRRNIAKLEVAAASLEERVGSRDQQVKELTTERETLRKESEKYQAQIRTLKEGQKPFKEERKALEDEKQKLQARVNGLEKDSKALQTKIGVLEKETETLTAEIAELETSDALVEELEAEKAIEDLVQRLKAKVSDNKELQQRIEELRQRIEADKTAKEDLEREFEGIRADLRKEFVTIKDNLEKELDATKAVLEQQTESFEAERKETQSKIDGLNIELAGSGDANISLASQCLELTTELTTVRANLLTVQTELSELHSHSKALESDNEKLKVQTADLTQKSKYLDKLRDDHSALEERANGLQSNVDKAQDTQKTLQDKLTILSAHARDLEKGTAFNKLNDEKTALETKLQALQTETSALTQSKTDLEALTATLQAEASKIPALTQSKTDLETQLQGLQTEADKIPTLTAQLATTTQQLEQARTAAQTAAGQVRDLQAIVGRLQAGGGRSASRSTSRAPTKSGGRSRQGRSPSSGLVFVRSTTDKGGVYVTTRDALAKGE